MVAWERDRSVPQGASMLLPMAWSPLFWLTLLLEMRVGWSSTVTMLFVVLGCITAGFPLFLLSEARPLVQQRARFGLGALAVLCVVPLVDARVPSWALCVVGLLFWLLSARLVQRALATPRWRALVALDAAALGPEWRRAEGLSGRFTQQVGATRALLSLATPMPLLDVIGPDAEHLRPADFGLDDREEA